LTRVSDPAQRAVINELQGGFPLTTRPFRSAGAELGLSECELLDAVAQLLEGGRISRFGPLWNVTELGGDVCLCAMAVPPERLDEVADQVNAHREVAHNYERTHALNMWFVISAERPERVAEVIARIEAETALNVHAMPKTREFFVGFRIEV
jgi:DNA-binding Lrp family transcriptional regulator